MSQWTWVTKFTSQPFLSGMALHNYHACLEISGPECPNQHQSKEGNLYIRFRALVLRAPIPAGCRVRGDVDAREPPTKSGASRASFSPNTPVMISAFLLGYWGVRLELTSPAMPAFGLQAVCKSLYPPGDEGRVGVCEMACRYGPG